jgi:hypothetical protein
VGAAIANALAQLAASLASLGFGLGLIGRVRWEAGALLRTTAASGAAGLVAWGIVSAVGGRAGLALGLLGGTLVFGLLGALLRILPAQDGAWLQEVAGERLRGLLRPAFQLCTARSAHVSRP